MEDERSLYSLFLSRLPPEIRQMIYELLLAPSSDTTVAVEEKQEQGVQPPWSHYPMYFGHVPSSAAARASTTTKDGVKHPTIKIRAIDPFYNPTAFRPALHESPQLIRSRFTIQNKYHSCTMRTTYRCINNPDLIHANILRTCKQIHNEAAPVLYGAWTFDFGSNVEAAVPFLSDLTPLARRCVRSVGLVKAPIAWDGCYERAEWDGATSYLATNLPSMRRLELGVVAGKPTTGEWDGLPELSKEDVEELVGKGWEGLEWVEQVSKIKVQQLSVEAIVEPCSAPSSDAMALWVTLSKSVEGGFQAYLEELMVT
jgi:hypothetical protein